MFQGTLVSNLHEGAAMIHALNALGYNAAAVGNHEFDFGPVGPHTTPKTRDEDARGALEQRMHEAKFPLLSANIVDERAASRWQARSPSSPSTASRSASSAGPPRTRRARPTPRTWSGSGCCRWRPPSAMRRARHARPAPPSSIAVVHAGGNCPRSGVLTDQSPPDVGGCEGDAESFKLARALAARKDGGRVDAIFGGHTHQGVTAIVDGIPILQAYDNARAFSKLELEVDDKGKPTGHFVAHAPERVKRRGRARSRRSRRRSRPISPKWSR